MIGSDAQSADEAGSADRDADYIMLTRGWVRFDRVIAPDFLAQLRKDLDGSYEKRRQVQIKNGIGGPMEGTCHHLVGDGNSLDRFLATLPLDGFIRRFFGGPYILNSYGAFMNRPFDTAYVSKIHKDVRTFAAAFRLLVNMLVMLDDFTIENGATWFLSGSHHSGERPNEKVFFEHGSRGTGKAGDIILFDSNLWHAAGENRSQATRRGLTLTFSRPFFKPQLDYPRLLGREFGERAEPRLRQVLGYDARVPESLDEFYQPPEKRAYKPGQG